MLSGRRRSLSSNITKPRMMSEAQAKLSQEEARLAAIDREMDSLRDKMSRQLQDLDERWARVAAQVTEIPIPPSRSNIYVDQFAIAWLPHHVIEVGGQQMILPAYPSA